MERLAIVYFSGTGNTRYIANKMKEVIIKKNIQVDLINIEKDKINSDMYNYIIIGGPVYVERYPEILLKYIEDNLSDYNGKCMMYSTKGAYGDTPVFKHAIKRIKNLNVTYYNYLIMPNNFYTFMLKRCSKDKENRLIEAAALKAQNMAVEFIEGGTNNYNSSNLKVELEINNDCTFCQRCIHNCPKNSFLYRRIN